MDNTLVPLEVKIAMDISRRELMRYENEINPAHRYEHTKRVFNLCKKILEHHSKANSVVVLVAAAFHDIGRRKKEGRHEIWSAEITQKIFEENKNFQNLTESIKNLIIKIIENHSSRDCDVESDIKEKIEFKILVDADRIDSFGPIGIIRASLDERFQKSAGEQLKHIKEKYDPDNYKLNSNGGQIVGNRYKTYLCEFEKIYKEQESIGND
jgi:HD superfamily phosphodiesterase